MMQTFPTNEFLLSLVDNFNQQLFQSEDDIKLKFFSEIVNPILEKLGKSNSGFLSETTFKNGGRADATYQNISFEYKDRGFFKNEKGIKEALYGRKIGNDRGLKDYLISISEIIPTDSLEVMTKKLTSTYGVGFDGENFLFARYAQISVNQEIDTKKTNLEQYNISLPVKFIYEKVPLKKGINRLAMLFSQEDKLALTKRNVLSLINPKSSYVRESILSLYNMLDKTITLKPDKDGNIPEEFSERARTLYRDWDRVFGTIYGNENEETDFTAVVPAIREVYGISPEKDIDSKKYLFSLQTFFNIFLKLLVNSFLSRLINPMFTVNTPMVKNEIMVLFDGENQEQNRLVRNFFESHYLEWFTYTTSSELEDVEVVNNTLKIIDKFDLSTFVLKPEAMQDILQEIYMDLIPKELRHIMGEYFSPDWIVEHVLDMVDFTGEDISKTLIDPTCGSGPFLTQALKRIIDKRSGSLTWKEVIKVSQNICGFDINPISVVAAKANFIITVLSAYFANTSANEEEIESIDIPIYIADSVLSPVVYSEQKEYSIKTKTVVGEFEIPKFKSINTSNTFLRLLSEQIHEKADFNIFWNLVIGKEIIENNSRNKEIIQTLFNRLYELHRSGKDSFWPIILKNSFAPVLITDKFDYVVGNPPWIGWKSMSKKYREGTLEVWQSYGIFEKSAYDKKTTHDDFGMAVTYVAVDQYLKDGGQMCFLLPASFLKSTKGGEGFRKFDIIRNNQEIPFAVDEVHDFSNVKLFTIPTIAVQFTKGKLMDYPLRNYVFWKQRGRKNKIDSHAKWSHVITLLEKENLMAQPVDKTDRQSAWLTLSDITFANKVLTDNSERVYKGRKGIEPAGAKGVYILKKPKKINKAGFLKIENDMSRQRRKDLLAKGVHEGIIEEEFIYPMIGGRNIERWRVKSNEFIIVPHDINNLYGISENELARRAPETFQWLNYFRQGLFDSRVQNGKFFNPDTQPFYRLDNVGKYTFAPYKVLWKEQVKTMSAVVVSSYLESVPEPDYNLFSGDKPIVVDSKVLMLACKSENEAYFVAGVLNSPSIREIIDGYAVQTNRGTDVLKYVAIPKYEENNKTHEKISSISKEIHYYCKNENYVENIVRNFEQSLDNEVKKLF